MSNDLISREALKKKFDDYIKANPNISGIFELGKIIIDTAPTVDMNTELSVAYLKGRRQGQSEVRPQGEWIIVKDEKWGDNVKCPFCGKELAGTDLNFCCKCGAKMKGGAE